MNRNQRKYVPKFRRHEIEKELKHYEFEEVLPPRSRRFPFKTDKPMANKCCYVSPVCKDVELSTADSAAFVNDHINNIIRQHYDFVPVVPSIKGLIENKTLGGISKTETSSQYEKQAKGSYIQTSDGTQWHSIDNTNDIEKILAEKERSKSPERIENIKISEVPHIKVIAEKFSKFQRNNVEIRKLEEKIVCVEYYVYESGDEKCLEKPIQKLRAYFSLKPTTENKNTIKILPSAVKNKFNISKEDLSKLNEKEIEIIDSKIAENKPYLDDIKRILNRRQVIRRKTSKLDLMTLYKIAKYNCEVLDENFYNTSLLSQKDLDEVKDLIIKKSMTSIHGLSRRTIKIKSSEKENDNIKMISQSIFRELLKYDNFDYNQAT